MPDTDPLSDLTDPNRAVLNDPRVKGFLDKIGTSEGADYNTLVGGKKINDLSRHPNVVGLTTSAGPSTAFGKYQITGTTNRTKLAKYSHLDYSPENQDVRAVELLRRTGALDALLSDDQAAAIRKAGAEWASLPGSTLPGRKNYAAFKAQDQDPLTELTKPPKVQPQTDPLTELTQQPSIVTPQGRGAAMANVATTPPQVPTRPSQPSSSLTSNDAAWHFGMTPDEVKSLMPRAMRVLQEAVTEDQRKKSLGQEIQQPSIQYQNQMRAKANLPLKSLAEKYYNGTDEENRLLGGNSLMSVDRSAPTGQTNDAALMEQATKNVSAFNLSPAANATSLYRMATQGKEAGFETDVQEEFQKLKAQQERANTPEMIAARKRIGSVPESLPGMPSPRGVASAFQRFGGETLKAAAGAADAGSIVSGLGPLASYFGVNPIPKVKDYLNQRGTVLEESVSMPMNARGEAIERSLPEKATDAVTGLGLSLAQLILLKKATGLNLGPLMALESALKNSDAKLSDRVGGAAEAYAMGKVLDQHLSRPLSALAFGAPTAVQSGLSVAQGNMKLEDALLQTGVQVVAGAVLGGKQIIPNVPRETLRIDTMPDIPDVPVGTISEPRAVKKGEQANAVSKGIEQQGGEQQYQGASQRAAIPENGSESRGVESQQASSRDRTEGSGQVQQEALNVKGLVEPSEQPNTVVPASGASRLFRIEGRDFTEAPDQAGMTDGRVRVLDSSGQRGVITAQDAQKYVVTGKVKPAAAQAKEIIGTPTADTSGVGEKVPDNWHTTGNEIKPGVIAVRSPDGTERLFVNTSDLSPEQLVQLKANNPATVPQTPVEATETKVVDDSGAPMRMFHGTKLGGDSDSIGQPHAFFTSDPEYAARYAAMSGNGGMEGQNIRSVFLDIKRPYELKGKELVDSGVLKGADISGLIKSLEAQGYDGIHIPYDESWVTFNPSQVRSSFSRAETGASEPQPIETKPSESPVEGERSFPKTLAATGREGGSDRTYQVVRDQEAIDKADARIKDNPETARQWASDQLDKGSGKEAIATGLRVADNLSSEASRESDPAQAAAKHAQASDLYSKLAARLTESGQEVQAASLAQKYSPSGAALEAQRIVERVKGKGAKPNIQDTQTARDLAEKYQAADARISELEKQITQLQAGRPVRAPRESSLTPLKAKLDKAAEDAALRIAATKAKMSAGELEFRNAGPLPGHIATHLTDYAIIGAAKIAKGGLTFAEWSSEMVRDLGEEIKPHLATIFRASKKQLDEQRATAKEESTQRGATKELTKRGVAPTPENIESLRQEKSKFQAERRQARVDLDRHYREIERKEQNHTLDAVLSLTRDSLLSARGVVRIAMGMGGKQVLDFGSRFVKAGTDVARSTVTGGPRTVSAPSFASTLRTIGGFVERAPSAMKAAVQGKPSEVMPNAHGGPTENPYVNLTVGIMQRIYAGKEAFLSSWAYPEALENNARVFALNDRADGITKLGQTNQRARDYLAGKLSFEGKRNQELAKSLAKQAVNYEVNSKQIVPSMKDFRAKEMAESPTELLKSMARQATDKAVYRQPYESKLAQKLGQIGTDSVGGKIARNIVLPFSKRPANNIADNLFGYTGLRIFGEGYKGIRESINGEFGPARIKSFNDAIGKGATGFAVMAVGAALAKSGKLISPLDKDKSKAGSLFINGKYYNISNVPVIGWLLGMGAAYQKDGAASLPKALYRMISEHPLLRSAKDISDMVEGLKSNKFGEQISEYAGRQASRFIPAPVKIAAEASDTEERQTKFTGKKADVKENLIAPTQASLPILRRTLPSTGTKGRLSVINPLYSKPISRRPQGRMIQ